MKEVMLRDRKMESLLVVRHLLTRPKYNPVLATVVWHPRHMPRPQVPDYDAQQTRLTPGCTGGLTALRVSSASSEIPRFQSEVVFGFWVSRVASIKDCWCPMLRPRTIQAGTPSCR
ncbi:hypothetical protein DHEL01_v203864 [Diaporthe helianthi]|uniref:Uncharacterized protein n=1 Tax=Diaporthe helianthi TaxID=158607 RepID=A0A2P5I5H0_DIAHE|nr:hypothetical protein DHEL01_v203864 [Diaporthe helianthi]